MDLSMTLRPAGTSKPKKSCAVIPQSLVPRSIVLDYILKYRNWSIAMIYRDAKHLK